VPSAIIALVFDHGTFGIALGAVIEQIEQVDVAVNRLLDGIGELLDDTSIVGLSLFGVGEWVGGVVVLVG